MVEDKNIFERSYNWAKYKFDNNVRGQLSDTTNQLGDTIGKGLKLEEPATKTIKEFIPVAAGVAATGGVLLVADPINKATKVVFKGAAQVLTGFGYLEKIPLIGGLFTGLGSVVETVGDYAGFAVAGATGLITHQLFTHKQYNPPATGDTADKGTGADPEKTNFKEVGFKDLKEQIPESPKQVVTAPELITQTGDDPQKVDYEALKAKRIAYINSGNQEFNEAYRKLMRDSNQSFENRAQFLRDARAFEASDKRKGYIDRLNKVGLTDNESNRLTVFSPRFANAKDDNPDNYRLPPNLQQLGEEFDKKFGGGCWQLEGKAVGTYKFEDLSITHQVDYIQQSLTYMDKRMDFYFDNCIRTIAGQQGWDFKDRQDSTWIRNEPPDGYTDPAQTPASNKMMWQKEHNFLRQYYKVIEKTEEFGGYTEYATVAHTINKGAGLKDEKDGFGEYQKELNAYKETLRIAENDKHKGVISLYKDRFKLMEQSYKLIENHGLAIVQSRNPAGPVTELEIKDLRRFNPEAPNMVDTQKWTWRGSQAEDVFTITDIFDEFGHRVNMATMSVNMATGAGIKEVNALTDAHNALSPLERSKGAAQFKTPQERFEVTAAVPNTPPPAGQPKELAANTPHAYTITDKQTGMSLKLLGESKGDTFTVTGYQVMGKFDESKPGQYTVLKPAEIKPRTTKEEFRAFFDEVLAKQNSRYRYEFHAMETPAPGSHPVSDLPKESLTHMYRVDDKLKGKHIAVFGKYENGTSGRFIATGYWAGANATDPKGKYEKFTTPRALNLENMSQQQTLLNHIIARVDPTQRYDMDKPTKNTPSKAQVDSKIWTAEELKSLHIQRVTDKYTGQTVNFHGTYDENTRLFAIKAYEVITTSGLPGKYEELKPPKTIDTDHKHLYNTLFTDIAETRKLQYTKAPTPKAEGEQTFVAIADGSDLKPLPTAGLATPDKLHKPL